VTIHNELTISVNSGNIDCVFEEALCQSRYSTYSAIHLKMEPTLESNGSQNLKSPTNLLAFKRKISNS
jgi:hypothetical protein